MSSLSSMAHTYTKRRRAEAAARAASHTAVAATLHATQGMGTGLRHGHSSDAGRLITSSSICRPAPLAQLRALSWRRMLQGLSVHDEGWFRFRMYTHMPRMGMTLPQGQTCIKLDCQR